MPRKIVVADSSSLILLTKSGVLEPVCESFAVHVEETVFAECCSKEAVELYPDAAVLLEWVRAGWIRKMAAPKIIRLPFQLGRGEAAAISLAAKIKADAVLTDDGKAIRACRFLAVPYVTSPRMVVDLVALKKITVERAIDALNRLRLIGRYAELIITEYMLMLKKEESS